MFSKNSKLPNSLNSQRMKSEIYTFTKLAEMTYFIESLSFTQLNFKWLKALSSKKFDTNYCIQSLLAGMTSTDVVVTHGSFLITIKHSYLNFSAPFIYKLWLAVTFITQSTCLFIKTLFCYCKWARSKSDGSKQSYVMRNKNVANSWSVNQT